MTIALTEFIEYLVERGAILQEIQPQLFDHVDYLTPTTFTENFLRESLKPWAMD